MYDCCPIQAVALSVRACRYAFASILLRRHADDGMQDILYNEQRQPFCRPAQVECQPQGPIVAKVVAYRASGGGFLSLALESVAGSGRITNVELRSSLTVCASAFARSSDDMLGLAVRHSMLFGFCPK